MQQSRQITVRYQSVDYITEQRRFKTLEGARKYAHRRVGEHPEYFERSFYATSFDGVGVVTVGGATLAEIFPPKVPARRCPSRIPSGMYWDEEAGCLEYAPNESGYIAMQGDPMAIYENEDDRVDPNPVYEDARSIIPGPKVDTWPDDCPF